MDPPGEEPNKPPAAPRPDPPATLMLNKDLNAWDQELRTSNNPPNNTPAAESFAQTINTPQSLISTVQPPSSAEQSQLKANNDAGTAIHQGVSCGGSGSRIRVEERSINAGDSSCSAAAYEEQRPPQTIYGTGDDHIRVEKHQLDGGTAETSSSSTSNRQLLLQATDGGGRARNLDEELAVASDDNTMTSCGVYKSCIAINWKCEVISAVVCIVVIISIASTLHENAAKPMAVEASGQATDDAVVPGFNVPSYPIDAAPISDEGVGVTEASVPPYYLAPNARSESNEGIKPADALDDGEGTFVPADGAGGEEEIEAVSPAPDGGQTNIDSWGRGSFSVYSISVSNDPDVGASATAYSNPTSEDGLF